MNISTTLKNITSIALGGFDGMHLAHQELFKLLDQEHGAIVVIETGYANMTPGVLRQKYTQHAISIYQLDTIKHLDDKGFIDKLYEDFPHLEHIVVGYDFHFGKDRSYSASDLAKRFKGRVSVVNEVLHAGISIHSHVIRKLLSSGNLELTKHLLGREYSVEGGMIQGQGLGKKELVPTINIQTNQLLPKEGVYASLTRINDEVSFHPSVTFLGHRLTTDGEHSLETHIINQDMHNVEKAEVTFVNYIRENQKFDDLISLKKRIFEDIEQARKSLQRLAL